MYTAANEKAPTGTQPVGAWGTTEHTRRKPSWVTAASTHIVSEFLDQKQDLFDLQEVAVVRFIQNRTLKWGRLYEAIPAHHFLNGVTTNDGVLVCAGLPLSRSSLRRTLDRLLAKGWVLRQGILGVDGGDNASVFALNLPRFQIDNEELVVHRQICVAACLQSISILPSEYIAMNAADAKKLEEDANKQVYSLLNSREKDESEDVDMLKKPRKERAPATPKIRPEGGSTQTQGGVHPEPPNRYNYVISVNNNKKTYTGDSASLRSGSSSTVEQARQRIAAMHEKKKAQAIGKLSSYESMRSVSTQDMQQVLDAIRQEDAPGVPRMVMTNKAYGMIRKRVIQYQVADVRDMFRFLITQWDSLAARYNYGIRKALTEGKLATAQPIPESPDSWVLATKLPWFIRHYNDWLAGNFRHHEERGLRETIKELESENERLARRAAASAQRRRPAQSDTQARAAVQSMRSRRRPAAGRDDDDQDVGGLGNNRSEFLRPRKFGE